MASDKTKLLSLLTNQSNYQKATKCFKALCFEKNPLTNPIFSRQSRS